MNNKKNKKTFKIFRISSRVNISKTKKNCMCQENVLIINKKQCIISIYYFNVNKFNSFCLYSISLFSS